MATEDSELPRSLWLQPQDPPPPTFIGVTLLSDRVVIAPAHSIVSQLIVTSVLLLVSVPVLVNWVQLGLWVRVESVAVALAVAMYLVWIRPAKRVYPFPTVAIVDERPAITGDIHPPAASECELPAGQINQVEVARRVYSIDRSEEHFELSVRFVDWPDHIVIQRRSFTRLSELLLLAEQLASRWQRKLVIQPAVVNKIRARSTAWGIACCSLMVLICLSGVLGIGVPQFRMRHWPRTDAEIVEFEPDAPVMEEGGSWSATRRIRYRYQVDGRNYESRGWNPSRFNYQTRASLDADSRGFAVGATVPCWYDPVRPEHSYVVNRLTALPQVLLVVGLAIALLSGWGIIIHRRLRYVLDRVLHQQCADDST